MARRLLTIVLALAAALLLTLPVAVRADEGDELAKRLEVVRKLSPEQKKKLREKLRHFRSLPKEQRDALRAKAKKLGDARLRELAGRDARRLRHRHKSMQAEIDQIMDLLGEQRFEGLDQREIGYIRHEAGRQFHRYVKAALLRRAGQGANFKGLPEEEKRQRMRAAFHAAKASLFNELSAEEQARIRALPKDEQRREHAQLLHEFRKRETLTFAGGFERRFLTRYLEQPAEKRRRKVEHWVHRTRWFEVAKVMKEELGLSRDVVRLTHHFRADEFAQLRKVYDETGDLTPPERRLRLEQEIRQIHGRAATDDERVGRRGPPKLHHLLRNGNPRGKGKGKGKGRRGPRRGKKRGDGERRRPGKRPPEDDR